MSGSIFHPFVLDNAAGQETVVGIGSDSEKYGVGISSHTHITGIQTVDGFLHAGGGIKDTSGNIGSSGKVLSSTGSGLEWIDPSEGSTANAVNVGTNLDSTNADQFVAFMGASSGNNPVRVDAGLKYNPSTNLLKSGSIIANGGGNLLKLNGQDSTAPSVNLEIHTHDTAGATAEISLNARDTSNVNRISKIVADADGDNNVNLIFHTDNTERLRISGTGNIIQSGTSNYIRINGGLQDKDGEDGDSGQVLSSTGSQVNWVNVGDLSAGSASQVAVSDESTDTTCFPLFATGATGNQSPKSGSNLTFNSSTGQLNATKFVGDGSGLTGISDTTYDLLAVQTSGNNNDPAIKLDASSGDDDEIQIVGGTNVTVTRNSDSQITISSTDTDTIPTASTLSGTTLASGITGSNLTDVGTLIGLNVNGTLNVQNGNSLDFGTATNNNIRGQIAATESNDQHLIIATSGGEDIAFRDGGLNGTTNMLIRGNGDVLVNNGNLTVSNILYANGQAVIDEVNINGNVVQANTSNELVVRGKGTGGSHHLKLDDDVTIVGDLTVQGVGGFVTGMIILWSGAANAIPSGWVLCNGSNSTPDLRDRFVIGAGNSYAVDATGGESTKTLGTANLPSHTHTDGTLQTDNKSLTGDMQKISECYNVAGTASGVFTKKGTGNSPVTGSSSNSPTAGVDFDASHSHDVTGNTGDQGGTMGQAFNILPPYYALCYIMKT